MNAAVKRNSTLARDIGIPIGIAEAGIPQTSTSIVPRKIVTGKYPGGKHPKQRNRFFSIGLSTNDSFLRGHSMEIDEEIFNEFLTTSLKSAVYTTGKTSTTL